jgi:hypothetical protein
LHRCGRNLPSSPDSRFAALAEHLPLIEQIEADSARGPAAKDIKLPNARPGSKRKSRVSKSAAPSNGHKDAGSSDPAAPALFITLVLAEIEFGQIRFKCRWLT